jgi:hypothetical protein
MGPKAGSHEQKGLSDGQRVSRATRLSGKSKVIVAGLFSLIAFFSLVDLVTSFVAYNQGLAEGNSLLLGTSQLFGVSVFNALAATKIAFLLGMGAVAVMGVKSGNVMVKRLTFIVLATFALIFALVSVNNLVAIGTF